MKRLLIIWVVFACQTASADLGDALDGMFLATGNEPMVYASQRRGGVDLGTLRLRSPMTAVNVVNLTAPNIRAGCGGIDIYGGSFTFINTEQFRQVLRQIGANAIGYAFKLALATMCEPCDRHLTTLQDMMNKINAGNLESCRWAQGIVNDLASGLPLKENVKGMMTESATGMVTDLVEAGQELYADAKAAMGRGDPTGAADGDPNLGNITWNALRASNTDALFGFPNGNITTQEVLMNISGSWMLRAHNDAEGGIGNTGPVSAALASTISYRDLIRGKDEDAASAGDAIAVYTCNGEDRCLNPEKNVVQWSFQGVYPWVRANLDAAAAHMADPVTAGTDHPPDLQEFLGGLPLPVMRHMMELQGTPAVNEYAAIASEWIADWYGVVMARSFASAIRLAFTDGTDKPTMTPNILENLQRFEADLLAAEDELDNEHLEKLEEMHEFVKRARLEQQDQVPLLVGDETAE